MGRERGEGREQPQYSFRMTTDLNNVNTNFLNEEVQDWDYAARLSYKS